MNLNFSASFNIDHYDVYKLKEALIKTIEINSYINDMHLLNILIFFKKEMINNP
jgi:tRNA A37 threonylcarbamoyladenosine biosynthesis protein TsaE